MIRGKDLGFMLRTTAIRLSFSDEYRLMMEPFLCSSESLESVLLHSRRQAAFSGFEACRISGRMNCRLSSRRREVIQHGTRAFQISLLYS
jgi:hypothetical protein